MAWTQDDLDAIDKAIKTGATKVSYSGDGGSRSVEYRSLDEMIKIRNIMRVELGQVVANGGRILASFSKGLGGS